MGSDRWPLSGAPETASERRHEDDHVEPGVIGGGPDRRARLRRQGHGYPAPRVLETATGLVTALVNTMKRHLDGPSSATSAATCRPMPMRDTTALYASRAGGP